MHPLYPSGSADAQAVAEYAGVDPGTVRQWRRRGHLTPVGGTERHPLYALDEVDAYLAARESAAA
jgi:predicted site-specific integrase-resolvase